MMNNIDVLENKVKEYCDNNDNELIMRYLVNEIFYSYQDNLLNYDDYKDVKILTLKDIVNIASDMCNLYYFNEGVNEIIGDNISDYLCKDKIKECQL